MDIRSTLLEITIYSGVIFAAVMLLKTAMKNKMSPLMHYAVWLVLIVRLLIPVTLASPVHFFVVPSATDSETAAAADG